MPNDVTVVMGMPSYGGVRPGTAAAFFSTATRKRNAVARIAMNSLLAQNFNGLWCHALNLRKQHPIKWFAMLHDDIEPHEPWWLDTLIDEAEAGGFDVLSVAMPIKDERGLTSCGLTVPGDDHRFVPACRFTMRELARMPETFTAADIGHADKALLVNTGCWICRVDQTWSERMFFTINDGIVRDEDGDFAPQVESEDWFFSRLAYGLGLKVGITRKVKAKHYGTFAFRNDAVWGSKEFDSLLLDKSLIAGKAT